MRGRRRVEVPPEHQGVETPIWQELMVGAEILYLRISPVYWGWGVPRGDGSPVIIVPGFMCTDSYLTQMREWLRRIGYTPYFSNITCNVDCPNLLISQCLTGSVEKAYRETGKKVHLIGHSLGGLIVRAAAEQLPNHVASVITLASPFRGVRVHPSILRTVELVRHQILERNGENVLPSCYTGQCTCDFLQSLMTKFPKSVRQTAIYSKQDGVVDWKVCVTGNDAVDFEVTSTHLGMVFSPIVYEVIARRLAG